MKPSNIFKMELYRNVRDKAYLIVTGIIALIFVVISILAIVLAKGGLTGTPHLIVAVLFGFLMFAGILGFAVFTMIYPYHLLSTDYNNRVLSLVAASGVKRTSYYFVKLLATLVTTLIAYLVIFIIPIVLLFGVYHQQVATFFQNLSGLFNLGQAWVNILYTIISAIAGVVVLYFAVIIVRGKFWSIFIYFGLNMGIGIVESILTASLRAAGGGENLPMAVNIIVTLLALLIFGFFGMRTLSKQDL